MISPPSLREAFYGQDAQYNGNQPSFTDNGNGTITDNVTGLMWTKSLDLNGDGKIDTSDRRTYEKALSGADTFNLAGYHDWRLLNAKELQSIVDYSRSPATTNSAAIDSVFNCTQITNEAGEPDYPYYWTSTTHLNTKNGGDADYIAFGRALGWMQDQYGNYQLLDVHGAGAQRCDPKAGDPSNFPHGRGPQGDVVRIYNYVRLVRNADRETSVNSKTASTIPTTLALNQNYPNPFNPTTVIRYQLQAVSHVILTVYDVLGRKVATLANGRESAGVHSVTFDAGRLPSGVYFCRLSTGGKTAVRKMLLVK